MRAGRHRQGPGHPTCQPNLAALGGHGLLYHRGLGMQCATHVAIRRLQTQHVASLRRERAALQRLLQPGPLPSYELLLGRAMISHLQAICTERGVGAVVSVSRACVGPGLGSSDAVVLRTLPDVVAGRATASAALPALPSSSDAGDKPVVMMVDGGSMQLVASPGGDGGPAAVDDEGVHLDARGDPVDVFLRIAMARPSKLSMTPTAPASGGRVSATDLCASVHEGSAARARGPQLCLLHALAAQSDEFSGRSGQHDCSANRLSA